MIELPWNRKTVPHCVLEINQKCNLVCRSCYREKSGRTKSIPEILHDLETLEKNQEVQTVSIAGGEPTLHPELVEVVELVHGRGHRVSLVTNGLLLTDELLGNLKLAGLDIVMIHVDEGQTRPDLSDAPTVDEINRLRREIARRVAAFGIDAGLCVTIYKKHFENLKELFEIMVLSPEINFLFATHAVEIDDIVANSQPGLTPARTAIYRSASTRNSDVAAFFETHFRLSPYACIPPRSADNEEKPCISYCVPVLHGKVNIAHPISSCVVDKALIRLGRLLSGRYLYYCKNRWTINAVQLIVNGIANYTLLSNTRILFRSLLPGVTLRSKRLVFENAPVVMPDGTVNCCDFCPNSTARNGRVIPVCLADHLAPVAAGSEDV
jgi:organic radical activating enzyme